MNDVKKHVKIKTISSIVFSTFVILVLVFPISIIFLQSVVKTDLPPWLISSDAKYLAGGETEEASLENELTWEEWTAKKLQNGIEHFLENNTPLKTSSLLINSSIQRYAIKTSNMLFNWDCYPTYYRSEIVDCPKLNMVMVTSMKQKELNNVSANQFAEIVKKAKFDNPNVRIVYQCLSETYSHYNNPSHKYVSNSYTEDWFEDNIFSHFDKGVICLKQTLETGNDINKNWFSSEHHWQVDSMIKAYNSIADVLQLHSYSHYDKKLIIDEWQGSCARIGLIMDYPSKLYDIPTDFSNLSCEIDGETIKRGARNEVLKGDLPIQDCDSQAYYNFYHWYYGNQLPELVYTNNSAQNDKTLLFIEQSYGVCMEPYLANNYKKTVCICPANMTVEKTLQQYIDEYDVDDVIIQFGPHPYSYLAYRSPIFLYN